MSSSEIDFSRLFANRFRCPTERTDKTGSRRNGLFNFGFHARPFQRERPLPVPKDIRIQPRLLNRISTNSHGLEVDNPYPNGGEHLSNHNP